MRASSPLSSNLVPRRAWLLLLVIALLIAYGSLYPFHFSLDHAEAKWRQFLTDARLYTSRGDVIGNVALFLPFGMVSALTANQIRRRWLALALLVAAGILLALALQLGQVFVSSRQPARADVVWNCCGIGTGLLLARFGMRVSSLEIGGSMHPAIVSTLLALWLSVELLPFVPSLDWQAIKNSLKPLVFAQEFSLPRFALHFAGGLVAGRLISEIGLRPTWLVLALTLLGVSFAKLFVVGLELSFSMAMGLLGAWLLWLIFSRLPRGYVDAALIAALLAAHTLNALKPFILTANATAFNWRPFYGQLQGSMLANIGSVINNLFIYGSALALWRESSTRVWLGAAGLLVIVFATEYAQTRIPGRHGDVTELLWVLLTLFLLTRVPRRAAPA